MSSDGSRMRKALRKDIEYKKYKNILKFASSLAEFDNYCKEMESMHQGRGSRSLVYKSISIKRLTKCILQDASYRSRCVEVMIEVNKANRMLSAATDAIKNHIVANYKPYLQNYRTKAERDTLINDILKSAYEKLSDYERIVDMCKFIIEDIDKFAWTAKHTLEALELAMQRENNLVAKNTKV